MLEPDVFAKLCPSRIVLDRIGDRWTVLVLLTLAQGPMRFSAIRERVQGVTPKVLTQTLRALERDGLLTRTVYAEVPPRVEYNLTDLGRDLLEPIDAVRIWAEKHAVQISENRQRHDAAQETE